MQGEQDYIYSEQDQQLLEGPFTVRQGKYVRSLEKRARALRQRLAPARARLRERIVEVPLVVAGLAEVAPGSRVADIGGASSILALQLVYLGLEVHVLDLRPYPLRHPQLHARQIDVLENDLPDNYFAGISCISVIEHVGLERYGGKSRADGDLMLLQQLRRLGRDGASVFVSAPYGQGHDPATQGPPRGYRIYDRRRWERLAEGFDVDWARFFVMEQGCWRQCAQEVADAVPTSRPVDAIFVAHLRVRK